MDVKEYLKMSKEELAVELAVRDRLEQLKLEKEEQESKSKISRLQDELFSTVFTAPISPGKLLFPNSVNCSYEN